MAYNKLNLLTRVAEIQNKVMECKQKGITQKWCYENVIFPHYHISYATFNEYMGMSNVRTDIKKLQVEKQRIAELKKRELTLF